MKKLGPIIAAVLFVAGVSGATAIQRWKVGEVLRYQDLNANFAHIHDTMIGNNHGFLYNNDISDTAGISQSKFAGASAAWPLAKFSSKGVVADCIIGDFCQVSRLTGLDFVTVKHDATGAYTVKLFPNRTSTQYFPIVVSTVVQNALCEVNLTGVSSFSVDCVTTATGVDIDSSFDVIILSTGV